MIYFVYVLQNSITKMLYIGFTENLKQRLSDHKHNKSLFTRRNKKEGIWNLIYFEGYRNKKDAIGREKFLKGGSGRKYLKKQLKNYFQSQNPPG